jgi:hypothetical protein
VKNRFKKFTSVVPQGPADTDRSGAVVSPTALVVGRVALVVVACAAAGSVWAQSSSGGSAPRGVPPAAAAPAPALAQPAANPIRQAAEQRGYAACGPRVEQVTNFLGFGPAAGAYLMAPAVPTGAGASVGNQRLLPLVMEIPLGPTSAIVTSSFAAVTTSGNCSATYDAVVYWPQTCEVVAASEFSSLSRVGLLKRDVLVLDGGPTIKVFLMVAGAGCISVKKELVS